MVSLTLHNHTLDAARLAQILEASSENPRNRRAVSRAGESVAIAKSRRCPAARILKVVQTQGASWRGLATGKLAVEMKEAAD